MSGEPCTEDHFPGDLCPHQPTGKVPYPSVTPGAVRAVLVHWALPLLARARRIADDIAERGCAAADPSVCAQLGEDIAALIGHGVTDQPPADELAEIVADEPPIRRRVPGAARLGTREHFLAVTGCDGSMVHYFGPPDRAVAQMFDSAGHPPNCPAYTPPADAKTVHAAASLHLAPGLTVEKYATAAGPESGEPAAPVEETAEARARRLDRERDDAGSEYRRRIYAADQAWRAIGGR